MGKFGTQVVYTTNQWLGNYSLYCYIHAAPPVIVQDPMNITDIVGATVTLHCRVQGFPTPDITWLKDGEFVNDTDISYFTSSFTTDSYLTIPSLLISDSGNYSCNASNDLVSLQYATSIEGTLTVNREFKCVYYSVLSLYPPLSRADSDFPPS